MKKIGVLRKAQLGELMRAGGYRLHNSGYWSMRYAQVTPAGQIERTLRIRMNSISVSADVKGIERHPVSGKLPWLNIAYTFYKDIVLLDDGRLLIGTIVVGYVKSKPAQSTEAGQQASAQATLTPAPIATPHPLPFPAPAGLQQE